MTAKRGKVLLAVALSMQILVLAGEYLNSVYPLWLGQLVKLETVPVDPRSLFRGNYARLRYDLSTIAASEFASEQPLKTGQVVYIQLQQGDEQRYRFHSAHLNPPEGQLFLRGRIRSQRLRDEQSHYTIRYGIEAYFANKTQALALEQELRAGGLAEVRVAANGKAALVAVVGQ